SEITPSEWATLPDPEDRPAQKVPRPPPYLVEQWSLELDLYVLTLPQHALPDQVAMVENDWDISVRHAHSGWKPHGNTNPHRLEGGLPHHPQMVGPPDVVSHPRSLRAERQPEGGAAVGLQPGGRGEHSSGSLRIRAKYRAAALVQPGVAGRPAPGRGVGGDGRVVLPRGQVPAVRVAAVNGL